MDRRQLIPILTNVVDVALHEMDLHLLSASGLQQRCSGLREHLHHEEIELAEVHGPEIRVPLTGHSLYDVTRKYHMDLRCEDACILANNVAFAIARAHHLLPAANIDDIPYQPSMGNSLFWEAIDSGLRYLSSGWDRIGLFLDLAFDLKLNEKCSFRAALPAAAKADASIVNDSNYKSLKRFRDKKLKDLEDGPGRGARHETTHVLSALARNLAEKFEAINPEKMRFEVSAEQTAAGRFGLIKEHHAFLLQGIWATGELIASKYPPTGK